MSTLPVAEAPTPVEPPRRSDPEQEPRLFAWVARLPTWAGLVLVLVAGALVHSGALRAQFMLDDFLHSSMLEGTFPVARHPLDLYNFVDDSDRAALLERGLLPWWSHPELTIRFCRPLSSGLLWADHTLLGEGALLRHLHSYLWWALAVLAAAALYRRAFSPRVAWIATFGYALAPCHAMPLAWIANREVLVSLAFGTSALIVYTRWREKGRARDAALAALLFSGALLAGEYGVSFGGYVLAFELVRFGASRRGVGENEHLVRRALGMLPFVAPALLYLLVRAHLGYGTIGSGYYLDPLHDPVLFLWMAPRRLAMLLGQGWFSLDQDTLTWSVPSWAMILGALIVGAVLVATFRRTVAGMGSTQRRTASWLALGSCFALAPVLAVVPGPRLIGASVLGIAASIALIIDHAWFPPAVASETPQPRSRRVELVGLVALALGFSLLVHGPVTASLMGSHFRSTSADFARQITSLRARVGDPSTADVIVVRGMAGAFFAPFAIDERGAAPLRFRVLAETGHVLVLRRGPRTLDVIASHERGVIPAGEANLFLAGRAVNEGDVFEVPGMTATILEVEQGLPRIVRFELDGDFDAPRLVWLNETEKAYFDGTPPLEGFGRPYDYDH